MKKGMKDALAPQGMFEDLGLKYVGPIDGHDRVAVEQALAQAKRFGGPVIVHVITHKGFGYHPAERNETDQFHQIGAFDVETGEARPAGRIWTDFFSEEMVALGRERQDIVGITAAMLYPVGLDRFAAAYPDRIFDVGIAEQHAVTSAAGLAMAGLHPVVAIYATFLNRAFDQVLHGRRPPPVWCHDRARPGGGHRHRRREPQRHVGPLDPPGGAGSAHRGTARRRPGARAAA